MKIEKVQGEVRYTLSSDNLKVGDKVFPIARGRKTNDGSWILHELDFRDFMCGFPIDAHIIEKINLKIGEIVTDHGYSHAECYFKIIKKEHQIIVNPGQLFVRYEWVELTN